MRNVTGDLPIVSARRPVNLAPQTLRFRRVKERRGPLNIRLWIPLTPLLALVSPVVMIASPFARLSRRTRNVPTVRAAWELGNALMALSGTSVMVETPEVAIRIYIF
jgi:hypothetical protein